MKGTLVFLLAAGAMFAADFNTGQAARLIIGQPQFTRQDDGASATLLGGISGLAYANDTLFVADANRVGSTPVNNRVLIFQNLSQQLPAPTDQLFYTQRCPVCVGQANVVLGQPDFTSTTPVPDLTNTVTPSRTGMRTPTAVATDGQHLVVADTDNNRVLIWNSIPTSNNAAPDVVVGQPNFTSAALPSGNVPTASSMRGPQGVWIQNGKLYVADTQNHRVLIYNSIPTSNGAAADVVLGQPNFTTFVEPDISQAKVNAQPNNLLNPVSVTSDGIRLYVSDLGHNRVLVWNTIPTANQAPADLAIGQPDLNSSISNNSFSTDSSGNRSKVLCDATGTDSDGKPTFPDRCNSTLSFPRYALSDGSRLFIADGGNDRVLVFNHVPTQSGEAADYVIGQLGGLINQASDAADSLRSPMSLAWNGTNLFVSDCYNRRVAIYSPADHKIPYTGVRNAASFEIYAVGSVAFTGTAKENETVTVTINGTDYKYTEKSGDDINAVVNGLVALINAGAGDPNAFATPNTVVGGIILTARAAGSDGNNVSIAVTTSANSTITATTSGSTLQGGQDAAQIAPGTVVSVIGDGLADDTASAPADAQALPTELAGAQVYFDGVAAPLFFVSPKQINAQIPYEFLDTTSINAYVRVKHKDGSVSVSTPVAVTMVPQNPGIFTQGGESDPRPGVVLHGSSNATGTVSVDGSVKAGDVGTVKIEDRSYTYTVVDGDTLATIRDHLIDAINQDPKVEAYAAGVFTRIRLRARQPGPDGNGITYSASTNDGSQVILTATGSALCCANTAGAPVTESNPAVPGETILVYATGLGLPNPKDEVNTGTVYEGSDNQPTESVSSLAGAKTANVLFAGLKKGTIGTWEVQLELNSDLPTNPFTQLTIAQSTFVSNIITFPLFNPNPPSETSTTPTARSTPKFMRGSSRE